MFYNGEQECSKCPCYVHEQYWVQSTSRLHGKILKCPILPHHHPDNLIFIYYKLFQNYSVLTTAILALLQVALFCGIEASLCPWFPPYCQNKQVRICAVYMHAYFMLRLYSYWFGAQGIKFGETSFRCWASLFEYAINFPNRAGRVLFNHFHFLIVDNCGSHIRSAGALQCA